MSNSFRDRWLCTLLIAGFGRIFFGQAGPRPPRERGFAADDQKCSLRLSVAADEIRSSFDVDEAVPLADAGWQALAARLQTELAAENAARRRVAMARQADFWAPRSESSGFTRLTPEDRPLDGFIEGVFLRILGRFPAGAEQAAAIALLRDGYDTRRVDVDPAEALYDGARPLPLTDGGKAIAAPMQLHYNRGPMRIRNLPCCGSFIEPVPHTLGRFIQEFVLRRRRYRRGDGRLGR